MTTWLAVLWSLSDASFQALFRKATSKRITAPRLVAKKFAQSKNTETVSEEDT
jgi:hypothetical protein